MYSRSGYDRYRDRRSRSRSRSRSPYDRSRRYSRRYSRSRSRSRSRSSERNRRDRRSRSPSPSRNRRSRSPPKWSGGGSNTTSKQQRYFEGDVPGKDEVTSLYTRRGTSPPANAPAPFQESLRVTVDNERFGQLKNPGAPQQAQGAAPKPGTGNTNTDTQAAPVWDKPLPAGAERMFIPNAVKKKKKKKNVASRWAWVPGSEKEEPPKNTTEHVWKIQKTANARDMDAYDDDVHASRFSRRCSPPPAEVKPDPNKKPFSLNNLIKQDVKSSLTARQETSSVFTSITNNLWGSAPLATGGSSLLPGLSSSDPPKRENAFAFGARVEERKAAKPDFDFTIKEEPKEFNPPIPFLDADMEDEDKFLYGDESDDDDDNSKTPASVAGSSSNQGEAQKWRSISSQSGEGKPAAAQKTDIGANKAKLESFLKKIGLDSPQQFPSARVSLDTEQRGAEVTQKVMEMFNSRSSSNRPEGVVEPRKAQPQTQPVPEQQQQPKIASAAAAFGQQQQKVANAAASASAFGQQQQKIASAAAFGQPQHQQFLQQHNLQLGHPQPHDLHFGLAQQQMHLVHQQLPFAHSLGHPLAVPPAAAHAQLLDPYLLDPHLFIPASAAPPMVPPVQYPFVNPYLPAPLPPAQPIRPPVPQPAVPNLVPPSSTQSYGPQSASGFSFTMSSGEGSSAATTVASIRAPAPHVNVQANAAARSNLKVVPLQMSSGNASNVIRPMPPGVAAVELPPPTPPVENKTVLSFKIATPATIVPKPVEKDPIQVPGTVEERRKLRATEETTKRDLNKFIFEIAKVRKQHLELMRKQQRQKDGHTNPQLQSSTKLMEKLGAKIANLKKTLESIEKALKASEHLEKSSRWSDQRTTDKGISTPPQKTSRDERTTKSSETPTKDKTPARPVASTLVKRYRFIDKGDNCCNFCEEVFPLATELLKHLHSQHADILENTDPTDRPWAAKPKGNALDPGELTVLAFRGVEFMIPCQAFYCKLCQEFSGDVIAGKAHLESDKHNANYNKFCKNNVHYAKKIQAERNARMARRVQQEKRKLEEAERERKRAAKRAYREAKDNEGRESNSETSDVEGLSRNSRSSSRTNIRLNLLSEKSNGQGGGGKIAMKMKEKGAPVPPPAPKKTSTVQERENLILSKVKKLRSDKAETKNQETNVQAESEANSGTAESAVVFGPHLPTTVLDVVDLTDITSILSSVPLPPELDASTSVVETTADVAAAVVASLMEATAAAVDSGRDMCEEEPMDISSPLSPLEQSTIELIEKAEVPQDALLLPVTDIPLPEKLDENPKAVLQPEIRDEAKRSETVADDKQGVEAIDGSNEKAVGKSGDGPTALLVEEVAPSKDGDEKEGNKSDRPEEKLPENPADEQNGHEPMEVSFTDAPEAAVVETQPQINAEDGEKTSVQSSTDDAETAVAESLPEMGVAGEEKTSEPISTGAPEVAIVQKDAEMEVAEGVKTSGLSSTKAVVEAVFTAEEHSEMDLAEGEKANEVGSDHTHAVHSLDEPLVLPENESDTVENVPRRKDTEIENHEVPVTNENSEVSDKVLGGEKIEESSVSEDKVDTTVKRAKEEEARSSENAPKLEVPEPSMVVVEEAKIKVEKQSDDEQVKTEDGKKVSSIEASTTNDDVIIITEYKRPQRARCSRGRGGRRTQSSRVVVKQEPEVKEESVSADEAAQQTSPVLENFPVIQSVTSLKIEDFELTGQDHPPPTPRLTRAQARVKQDKKSPQNLPSDDGGGEQKRIPTRSADSKASRIIGRKNEDIPGPASEFSEEGAAEKKKFLEEEISKTQSKGDLGAARLEKQEQNSSAEKTMTSQGDEEADHLPEDKLDDRLLAEDGDAGLLLTMENEDDEKLDDALLEDS